MKERLQDSTTSIIVFSFSGLGRQSRCAAALPAFTNTLSVSSSSDLILPFERSPAKARSKTVLAAIAETTERSLSSAEYISLNTLPRSRSASATFAQPPRALPSSWRGLIGCFYPTLPSQRSRDRMFAYCFPFGEPIIPPEIHLHNTNLYR